MPVVNAVTGKAVDPTIMSALSGSLTFSYGVTIDPNVVSKIPFNAPILQRLRGMGPDLVRPDLAATFAILTAAQFTGDNARAAFTVGGDPNPINPQRGLHSVTKKSYGASGGIQDVHVIASTMPGAPISINQERFSDDAELLLNLLYTMTLQGIDYDIIQGNSGSVSDCFDGIETKVVSGTSGFYLDASGADVSAGLINQHIAWMMSLGVYPTAIYCNPIMHLGIVNAYENRTNASINIVDGKTGTLGLWATSVVTPAGELPIISDRYFTITSDGTSVTGDIFFAVEWHNGMRIIYPEWQVLPTAVPLSRVMGRGRATTTEMAIWSHLVLVEKTNWWAQGRLANVKCSFTPSVSTGSVGTI